MSLPPPPPPPTHRAAPATSPLVGATWALIGATLLASAVAVAVRLPDDDGGDHPEGWDRRVADLADYVEEARGLEFDHPVHVDFLTPEQYTEATTTDLSELQEEELAELERGAAQLRALGVASGPLDLGEALNQTIDVGTAAFYSPDDERVRVRGTELTVGLRVTIVHELTHALQDQHFDLGALLDDDAEAQVGTRRALAEGDANRIGDAYAAEVLTDDERAAYETELAAEVERSESATQAAGVPPFIQASFAVPYALGPPFVQMLVNDGGNDAVDDAFEDPPTTEEHLFDPASYLAGEGAEDVDLGLDDDVEIVESGAFGTPAWYLVLAERTEPPAAFEATLGWDGDGYAVYERDGGTCVRAVFRGEDDDQDAEMADAIDAWVEAMPGGRARAVEVDGHPGIDACDPGTEVDVGVTGRSIEVLALPNVWAYLVGEAIGEVGPETARCFAAEVLDAISYDRIAGSGADEALADDVQRAGLDAVLACGSGDR